MSNLISLALNRHHYGYNVSLQTLCDVVAVNSFSVQAFVLLMVLKYRSLHFLLFFPLKPDIKKKNIHSFNIQHSTFIEYSTHLGHHPLKYELLVISFKCSIEQQRAPDNFESVIPVRHSLVIGNIWVITGSSCILH